MRKLLQISDDWGFGSLRGRYLPFSYAWRYSYYNFYVKVAYDNF